MSVKGLHKMIYPFAPDQSGAASVLYSMGGMIIVVDAGGCAGNICGFDEPRWLGTKSAVFSAGLRDMDAIMGRDDLMIDKIAKASQKLDASFIAIVGTPVPATIATDYKALRRMAKRRTGRPVITMDTSGAGWYDEGMEKAYAALIQEFAGGPDQGELPAKGSAEGSGEDSAKDPGKDHGTQIVPASAGVLGVTPLDTGLLDPSAKVEEILKAGGCEKVCCYGADGSLQDFAEAGSMERNIVVSAAGLDAARLLKERFGTPYECFDPLAADEWDRIKNESPEGPEEFVKSLAGKRILIIHQQVRANTIRDLIRRDAAGAGVSAAQITTATWFMLNDEIKEDGDIRIREESDFFDLAERGGYDIIMADASFRKAAKGFGGRSIDLPHFAVSGTLE